MKSLKIPNVNQKQLIKGQTVQWPKEKSDRLAIVSKTQHRKLKIEHYKPHLKTLLLRKGKLFLLH